MPFGLRQRVQAPVFEALNAQTPHSCHRARRPYPGAEKVHPAPPSQRAGLPKKSVARKVGLHGFLENFRENPGATMLRYDRIPLRQAGAELRASYGQLGSYTYERCYRAIADGRLTAVAEGRRLFI